MKMLPKENQTFICLISENCAFSINGIEIDLKELELYEKRLAEKRQNQPSSQSVAIDSTASDDLDDYLDKLNIAALTSEEAQRTNETTKNVSNNETHNVVGFDSNDAEQNHELSFPLLLYGVMSILFALSTAYRKTDSWSYWINVNRINQKYSAFLLNTIIVHAYSVGMQLAVKLTSFGLDKRDKTSNYFWFVD